MEMYNKIMKYFWLVFAILSFLLITYFCIVEDYKTWIFYYVFSGIAFLMYFMKVWMVKRMEKHAQYLQEQKNKKS